MFKLIACLSGQHDWRLMLLSLGVCVITGLIAATLMVLTSARAPRSCAMCGLIATALGTGIWATHFIGMLAFQPHMPIAFDPLLTSLSLVLSIGFTALALRLSRTSESRAAVIAAGVALGGAIAVMHFVGMAALRIQAELVWNRGEAALAVALSTAASLLAFALLRRRGAWGALGGGLAISTAILATHYGAMSAVALLPDSSIPAPVQALPPSTLAMGVAMASGLLLLLGVAGVLLLHRQQVQEEARLREIADSAIEGLAICQDGAIVTANTALEQMVGAGPRGLEGRPFTELFDRHDGLAPEDVGEARLEATLIGGCGTRLPVELIGHKVRGGGERRCIAVRDLRDRLEADSRIRFLAEHDSLTALHNRDSFNRRLDYEISRHRRAGDRFAVLCLDLDRFKEVNDVFGHAGGDAVLQAAARRLEGQLAEGDVLARLGGDEFAIIRLANASRSELTLLGERLIAAIAPEVLLDQARAEVGVSIGVAVFPEDAIDARSLMRNADAALYRAKAEGRGVCRLFEARLGEALRERQAMEVELRRALRADELTVVFQPQARLSDEAIFGFEVLARWNSRKFGMVSPALFVQLAEETGLIFELGEWVLWTACREAASWPNPLRIAVNISGVQLRSPRLPDLIAQVLVQSGLAPGRLEIEVTETAMIKDMERALDSLNRIKAMGVGVAMDDFGTGYSSLANLRAFPFDKIKIDQSFIRDVEDNPQSATIARAIIGLGRSLELTVLAEGIESNRQLEFLRSELCAEGQGYHLGRPAEIETFAALVGRKRARAA